MVDSRIPPGASLLLIGSGLYWILSSQLISSFTVLTPGLFQANALGSSAIGIGAAALIPFIISYLALSQGLGLFMLRVGSYLFGPLKSYRYLPFVSICGAATFGPASNLVLLLDPNAGLVTYLLGALGCTVLSIFLFTK